MEKYVIINYTDLTKECQDKVSKGDYSVLELEKDKTGYIFNRKPI